MTITERAFADARERVGYLPPNSCKARYGVGYVRTVCSQAGVGFVETSPDEDYLAVDGTVSLPAAGASVQIKCSSQFKIGGNSASWPAEIEWRNKWRESRLPVYFILVILDVDSQDSWIIHDNHGMLHRAAAFWTRVDKELDAPRISVPKRQRLTADTMNLWAADVLASFGNLGQVQ